MINELIEQIGGRDRLQEIYADGFLKHGESKLMARALLAVLDAKPVGTVSMVQDLYAIPRRNIATVNMRPDLVLSEMRDGDNLYTAPPAASVPDGWIKCSDRIPVQRQSNRYVALNLLLNERTVAQGGFDDGEFWIEGVVVNNVTRWMPLPAAPAPGGEK